MILLKRFNLNIIGVENCQKSNRPVIYSESQAGTERDVARNLQKYENN